MKPAIFLALLALLILPVSAQDAGDSAEKPCACCTEKHSEFDFWVGDWDAYGPKGNLVGSNLIKHMQDRCVIQENWTSAGLDFTGTSYNFYDADADEWVQLWIDNTGGSLYLRGGMVDGSMVLKSKAAPRPEGGSTFNRITWTPNDDGSVRQHWETSTDYGQSWTTLFDGIYRKKAGED